MNNGPSAGAEAVPGSYVQMTTVGGETIQMLRSAHIRVNADQWAAGRIHCGTAPVPSTAVDYAMVLAHEAGHVLGLGHGAVPFPQQCAMTMSLPNGRLLGGRCTLEESRLRMLFGPF